MSTPLVQVKDAARWFDVSPPWLERKLAGKPRVMLRAVDGVSFEINRGETLALVGESGCGKSTVARMLVGLYGLTRGDIRFDGQPLSRMSEPGGRELRKRLQMIFQDPYASLNPRWRVGRIFLAGDAAHLTPPFADAHNHRIDAGNPGDPVHAQALAQGIYYALNPNNIRASGPTLTGRAGLVDLQSAGGGLTRTAIVTMAGALLLLWVDRQARPQASPVA